MALFLSTILNKMDAKSRVSVPSAFRNSLQKQTFKGVIAFPSYQNNRLMLVVLIGWKAFLIV